MQHTVLDSTAPSPVAAILLVEDDPMFLDIMRTLLEGDGLLVSSAQDGQAAVAWAEQNRPAMAILDLGLPLVDGVAVATFLRERYGWSLPILIVSADEQAYARTRHLRPCGLTRKPFDLDDLLAAVRQGLSGQDQRQGTGGSPPNASATPSDSESL